MKNTIELLSHKIPDSLYLNIKHKYHTGEKLNLSNPKTFSEKIHWLKLNHRKNLYSEYCDKLLVRSHISKDLGDDYLIPLIDVYENIDQIDWDNLPEKFVLKCTHGSGCNIICNDKSNFNIADAKNKLKKWMRRNWYWYGREWPYKFIEPKIILEKYMVDNIEDTSLTDYKFYCFDGSPKYCQVIRGRHSDETIDFYDTEWNHMEFTGLKKTAKKSSGMPKPNNHAEMLDVSSKLSEGIPFVRVDLYSIQRKVYFGELTFFPQSGFGEFIPKEWNKKIGELIKLPK
ncbi:ATP-grasp fold amidoligase family protein [Cytobacillus sp. FSL R7-0680]|uniref:ATP-grasp fold amidoligase family protein n=1 Tax=Cytobacillus sp. FSL R7-0680 TaxID=2921689 RepID=UPI0030FA3A24